MSDLDLLSDLQLHQIDAHLLRYGDGYNACETCGAEYPCAAARARDEIARLTETAHVLGHEHETNPSCQLCELIARNAELETMAGGWQALADSRASQVVAAEAKVAMLVGNLRCDDCAGQGWYADGPTDSPEQVQCARCSGTGWALGEDFALVLRDDPTLSAAAAAHDAQIAAAAVEAEREKWREADNAVALAAEYVANDWHWDDDDPNRVVLHDTLAEDIVTLRKVVDASLALLDSHPSKECKHDRSSNFDRSICARDGWMHTFCDDCGQPLDGECGKEADSHPSAVDKEGTE
jgi:hypothetical protein